MGLREGRQEGDSDFQTQGLHRLLGTGATEMLGSHERHSLLGGHLMGASPGQMLAPWRAWGHSLVSGKEDSATHGLFVPPALARVIC